MIMLEVSHWYLSKAECGPALQFVALHEGAGRPVPLRVVRELEGRRDVLGWQRTLE